ncbi:adhesion G protein-coupled receptor F5-like [Pangasianodon hypophthalmus]|uniref:adhesion G protein-coupled receptor F5-like n=1 Tax=Pangasianodon hypophthalmus TaxID=310915 RepID=UPI002306E6B0|nr:adhesion G protein-coupled receptor F5-like [Pangasianodon hypophthalmus]
MRNGIELKSSDRYIIEQTVLTVKSTTPDDSGQYECRTTENSIPSVIWQRILIPDPNIQVSNDKFVKCENSTVMLQCCAHESYEVKWSVDPAACIQPSPAPPTGCILCNYKINTQDCQTNELHMSVTCQLTKSNYKAQNVTINAVNGQFTCYNDVFGPGNVEDVRVGDCNGDMVGYQKAKCNSAGQWQITENNCVLRVIQNLKDRASLLNVMPTELPQFVANLSIATETNAQNITSSSSTILTIASILQTIANISQTILVSKPILTGFLQTLDVIGSIAARGAWMDLNQNNATRNASSELLKSIEIIARRLPDENIEISTNSAHLKRTFITVPFLEVFGNKSTTYITIPMSNENSFITIIVFSALDNVLPVRIAYNDSLTNPSINGDVAVIEPKSTINNISFSFAIKNKTLGKPQCVFWNFSLLNGIGGWDSTGCQLKTLGNESERFTCECNHTTSFSILMSPFSEVSGTALNFITYIGVGISMASLVLCLIIEIIIWKSMTRNDTSYMRHVSVVNIAVSLLIADVCFIIGAAVVKEGEKTPEGPCSTATFFMHFFYLALFFWMLLSALLLLYRTLMVFSRMTRGAMMAIAFTVGYGAPLIIAVITVASTAGRKGYIKEKHSCWLNWNETKALLAFVIPALTTVAINLLVLIVVLCKMMRRGVNATTQPDDKHPLMVIARCVGILTPLFGLTWGFGIGTMVSSNFGIHVVFAFLNSLQGFFILLFGTLLDSKVRDALAGRLALRNSSSNRTRSTSAGPLSSGRLTFFQRLWRRDVYHVSEGGILPSSSSNSYRVI